MEAASNDVLTRQWEQLQPQARTFISIVLPASPLGSIADRHVPILEALARGAPDEAETAMHEHLAEVVERLRPLAAGEANKEMP